MLGVRASVHLASVVSHPLRATISTRSRWRAPSRRPPMTWRNARAFCWHHRQLRKCTRQTSGTVGIGRSAGRKPGRRVRLAGSLRMAGVTVVPPGLPAPFAIALDASRGARERFNRVVDYALRRPAAGRCGNPHGGPNPTFLRRIKSGYSIVGDVQTSALSGQTTRYD